MAYSHDVGTTKREDLMKCVWAGQRITLCNQAMVRGTRELIKGYLITIRSYRHSATTQLRRTNFLLYRTRS